jgi:hypothetical protein
VNVGDNSSVSEMDECVIHKSVVNRTGVEDGEVGVFNTRGMEIRMGVGTSM